MQTIKQLITAANGFSAKLAGTVLLVQGCDTTQTLTVTLTDAQGNRQTVNNVGAGTKLKPLMPFMQVDITTSADANVQFIVTAGDIDIQLNSIGSMISNTNANPVPVAMVSEPGAPFPVTVSGPVTVTGVTLTATNVGVVPAGTTSADLAPVAVGNMGVALVAALAGRKSLRIYNAGAGNVALTTAAATTFAAAALILQPGDVWIETDAPQLAWFAVSDTSSTVNLQAVS